MRLSFSKPLPLYFLFLAFVWNEANCQSIDEYSIKAVWIGKFTQFIEWPPEKKGESTNFCIGIYKTNPFNGNLESLYANYSIWGKPVRIKYIENLDSISTVHILFIPNQVNINIDKITKLSKAHRVLLISEFEGYGELGMHINFYVTENKVRFEINESAMRDSGFFVSFRLLTIAKIVKPISKE